MDNLSSCKHLSSLGERLIVWVCCYSLYWASLGSSLCPLWRRRISAFTLATPLTPAPLASVKWHKHKCFTWKMLWLGLLSSERLKGLPRVQSTKECFQLRRNSLNQLPWRVRKNREKWDEGPRGCRPQVPLAKGLSHFSIMTSGGREGRWLLFSKSGWETSSIKPHSKYLRLSVLHTAYFYNPLKNMKTHSSSQRRSKQIGLRTILQ